MDDEYLQLDSPSRSASQWLVYVLPLVRNYERLPETSEAFIYLALICIMLRRLA